ncbi:MAG TPA: hypoxanthine phosphoribosyltransferase [Candidatus Faeciplasma avium]|uniref:Hypoxanthine phosphoribosyltransferase n=1 Tax=Candidatus Faeciplasma avium TaxID=2840798 RepID=A0A9D1NQU4_9FIRM|nr:hypoxanthine phosphoribosyltransferase [Candidatus Faeciplasma avium]
MTENGSIKAIISKEEIQAAVERMGKRLTEDYAGKNLLVLGVMKGSFIFMADLVRSIRLPIKLDFIHAKSYEGTESTGVVDVKMDAELDVKGKQVLLVEDILDTGKTLSVLKKTMLSRGAEDVKIVAFLDKTARRLVDISADYSCFTIEDGFLVGYGLDYNEDYRNLDYIGELIL